MDTLTHTRKQKLSREQEDLSLSAIQDWLIAEISELLSLTPAEVNVAEDLTGYGLSSMTGAMLAGDIEDWLGIRLDPIAAWEYPTIESLSRHVLEQVGRKRQSK